MSRRLNNLERLCNKLECRFGRSDSLFLQAKTELETHRSHGQMEPLRYDWSKPYDAFVKSWCSGSRTQFRN
jgi:hypothetical protein